MTTTVKINNILDSTKNNNCTIQDESPLAVCGMFMIVVIVNTFIIYIPQVNLNPHSLYLLPFQPQHETIAVLCPCPNMTLNPIVAE